jgi:hypothetical protein
MMMRADFENTRYGCRYERDKVGVERSEAIGDDELIYPMRSL